jgi:hypothetical protein
MNQCEREYILCHEKHHIIRLDYIIKPLSFLLLTVYWFNPLIWIAYFCMCRDMEMSCDEKVLSKMGTVIKKDYSRSLLSFSNRLHFPAASPLAFGESGVKTRVKNVLNFKKPKTWLIIVTVVFCAGVIIACAANPQSGDIGSDKDIFGYYEFDKNIYTWPLSSFLPVKGYMPYFKISQNALKIISSTDSSAQEIPGVFEKKPINKDDFKSMFDMDLNIPDISSYKECYQYAVFSADGAPEYHLYVMDGEIWLVNIHKNREGNIGIGSIYKLVKTDKISTEGGVGEWKNIIVSTD